MDDHEIEKWLTEYEDRSRESIGIVERGEDDSANSERRVELLVLTERKLQTYIGSPEWGVIYDDIEERKWRACDLIDRAIKRRDAALRASLENSRGSEPGVHDSP
ncbi:MAG: hypothetical protein HY435_00220 [Candidatus Liptonbacteria bacterium]|nr:hypothetical protein [Candidatus Liptonbacteria bacterium]